MVVSAGELGNNKGEGGGIVEEVNKLLRKTEGDELKILFAKLLLFDVGVTLLL